MSGYNVLPGLVKVTVGRSVLFGQFDYPVEIQEERFFFNPEHNFFSGTIDFILEMGPSMEFQWDSVAGALVDSVEAVE